MIPSEEQWQGTLNVLRSTPSSKQAAELKAMLHRDRQKRQTQLEQVRAERDDARAHWAMLRDLVADLQDFIYSRRHTAAEFNAMMDRVNVTLAAVQSQEVPHVRA